jgi:hypothetical protein
MLLGIELENFILIVVGIAISIGVTYFNYVLYPNGSITSLGTCVSPIAVAVIYVFTLRQGKPKSFDVDMMETVIEGPAWGFDFKKTQIPNPCESPTQEHRKKIVSNAPNGWLAENLIVYNRIGNGGVVSKGYRIQVPDLRQGSESSLLQLNDALRRFLHTLDEGTRCQIAWSVNSDYRQELLKYDEITRQCFNPWSKRVREGIFERLSNRMKNNQLRREQLVIFLSKPITTNTPLTLNPKQEAEYYRSLLKTLGESLHHNYSVMNSILNAAGCTVDPMDDEDHARYFAHFLNPSYSRRANFDPIGLFRSEETIQENFWNSGCQSGKNFGFFSDGYYHNIVVLKRRPQRTTPGMVFSLTNLPFLDYSITVNLYPKNVQKEMSKEEATLTRVQSSYADSKKQQLLTAMEIKQAKIRGVVQQFVCKLVALGLFDFSTSVSC